MADSKKQKIISQTNTENKKNEITQEEDFEDMLERAKEVLSKLNAQEITLKESLALYEQGMQSLKYDDVSTALCFWNQNSHTALPCILKLL